MSVALTLFWPPRNLRELLVAARRLDLSGPAEAPNSSGEKLLGGDPEEVIL